MRCTWHAWRDAWRYPLALHLAHLAPAYLIPLEERERRSFRANRAPGAWNPQAWTIRDRG
jgi:hypothetical protein